MTPAGTRRPEAQGPAATQPSPRAHFFGKLKYLAINIFLVFHIVAIACWCIPMSTPLTQAARRLVQPYFVWVGLFQSWDMFSPNPKISNAYLEAIIIYKDGSTELWSFPRMELLTLPQDYVKERYRKFEENLASQQYAPLWPDAARYIARLKSNHSSPPQTVMLLVRWSDIIPPKNGSYDRGPWDVNVFYKYTVGPGDLQ
jgi:hypothetical protein